jgi:multidrug efflux pump subunit AcrA (membrane-fusion protein)
MAETSTAARQEDGKTVLENLRNLRFLEGDEKQFWDSFLTNIAALCKSSVVFLIIREHDQWMVRQEFFGDEAVRTGKDAYLVPALDLAERAHQNGFAYEPLDMAFPRNILPCALVSRVDVGDAYEKACLFLIADRRSPQQFNDIVVRTQLVSDIPSQYYIGRRKSDEGRGTQANGLLVNALETSGRVMEKGRFVLAAMTLVNELASRFDCSRVSLGWKKGDYIRALAISHMEDFKRETQAVGALEGLFEEAREQKEAVVYPKLGDAFVVDRAHQQYGRNLNLRQVASLPVQTGEVVAGVVTCEKQGDPLTVSELETLRLILGQVAPWLESLNLKDRWLGGRLALALKGHLASLLGVEHSFLKAAVILLSALLLYAVFGTWHYRVEGSATLRTDSVSFISAPFDGMIGEVIVREGDEVKKGALLLKLDTKELLLREVQEEADIVRYQRESEKSRASEALADMKIAQSKIEETRAGLDKVRYYLQQAHIRAPHDGVIVEGDSRKLLGAPVSKGDVLLKIAKVDAMYTHIRIGEKDIDQIAGSTGGELTLLSRPDQTMRLKLDKLIPMAEVDQREGNIFVLRAAIDGEPQDWWRPGMSGVAKIDVGDRRIIWILTHRLTDFIRMYFWW